MRVEDTMQLVAVRLIAKRVVGIEASSCFLGRFQKQIVVWGDVGQLMKSGCSTMRQSNHGRAPDAVPQVQSVLHHCFVARSAIEACAPLTA